MSPRARSSARACGWSVAFWPPYVTADANSGHGIVIEGGLELIIAHNIIDNVDKYGVYLTGANPTESATGSGWTRPWSPLAASIAWAAPSKYR